MTFFRHKKTLKFTYYWHLEASIDEIFSFFGVFSGSLSEITPKKIDFGVTLAAFSHDSPKISSFAT